MQNFIVLGFIPGTQVQITFKMWLIGFAAFVFLTTLVFRRKALRSWLVAYCVSHAIRHLKLA